MKLAYSDMPIETIIHIAYFLNPISILTLNKKLYLDLYSHAQYWQDITKRDFGWVLKEKRTSEEEKNYLQLYKILTCYSRALKNKGTQILSPKKLLPELQKVTQNLDAKFIPQWLNEQIILESFIISKPLTMNLFGLATQYNYLFGLTQDSSAKTNYQQKAIKYAEMALALGFEQKNNVSKKLTIGILTNLNSGSDEKLFKFLEKHYQYRSIYFKESNFTHLNVDFDRLHQQWWDLMQITSNPQEKSQQIIGLLDLYNYYQHSNDSLPGLSLQQITERITSLYQIADSLKGEKNRDSKGPVLFPAPSGRQRISHTPTKQPPATSCLIS